MMDKNLTTKLETDINKLKKFLSNFDTIQVLGKIANDLTLHKNNLFKETKLSSPHKQLLYLAGLLLSTDQLQSRTFKQNNYKRAKDYTEKISEKYSFIFFPTEEEFKDGLSQEWKKIQEVSMSVFLHYFNTTTLCYKEQLVYRIKSWFYPFNQIVVDDLGLSFEKMLNIYEFIYHYLDSQLNEIPILTQKALELKDEFLSSINVDEVKTKEDISKLAQNHPVKDIFEKLSSKIGLMYHIPIVKMKNEYGELEVNKFIEIFSLTREKRDFRYYTEDNPVERSPLWKISAEYVFVPFLGQLLNALYFFSYYYLEKSSVKDKFYSHRAKKAEQKTKHLFESFFLNSVEIVESYYENDKVQNEHDLLIKYEDKLIIIEIKASKQKEPFRDPEKSFTRIKRDFKSDRGIQKAYDQALRVKENIQEKPISIFYDNKGNPIYKVVRSDISKIYIICITVEQLGVLASNLSFLLSKPDTEPYPWSINLYDLETLLEGFRYKNKTLKDFFDYLNEREKYHLNFFSSDELEIAGYYLTWGRFPKEIKKENTVMFFAPEMSDIFDKIYFEKLGVEYEYKYDDEPVAVNVNEEVQKMLTQERNKRIIKKKKNRKHKISLKGKKKKKKKE